MIFIHAFKKLTKLFKEISSSNNSLALGKQCETFLILTGEKVDHLIKAYILKMEYFKDRKRGKS